MTRHKENASYDSPPLPPPPKDVLAYWRWWYEVVLWPSAPKTFQEFWYNVESCVVLKLLCEHPKYETKWKHALLHYLGKMWWGPTGWNRGTLQLVVQRTGKRGRPSRMQAAEQNVEWYLCVLDLIVQGLLGSTNTKGRPSQHWKVTTTLLKHFFPEKFPETWNNRNLKGRVNNYLRTHRQADILYQQFIDECVPSAFVISEKYRQQIQAHLEHFPR